jgi:hypothetical protein
MKTFIVSASESVATTWKVFAETEEEAVEKALAGEAFLVEQGISWPDLNEVYELEDEEE